VEYSAAVTRIPPRLWAPAIYTVDKIHGVVGRPPHAATDSECRASAPLRTPRSRLLGLVEKCRSQGQARPGYERRE